MMARVSTRHVVGGLLASCLLIPFAFPNRLTEYVTRGTWSGIVTSPCRLIELCDLVALSYVYLWWTWLPPLCGLVLLYRHPLRELMQHQRLQVAGGSSLIGGGLVFVWWQCPYCLATFAPTSAGR